MCSFQLIYGKLFIFFPDKAVFLVALVIFEVGSVVCATAQSSFSFIIGRAVAGLGSAGINAGYIMYLPIYAWSYWLLTTSIATVSLQLLYTWSVVLCL